MTRIGPLAGLSVIEMAAIGPVPLAGQLMADLGADVVVVSRPGASAEKIDITRRNKRSIILNLKTSAGLAAATTLIGKSDILIEGFRPRVMERLGLGPEDFDELNPALIYARMTGWGQDGPMAMSAGHDINYLSITGALHAIGSENDPPPPPLNLLADYGGGTMFLLFGVLSALHERSQSGLGQVIDVAMTEGVSSMMSLVYSMLARQQWTTARQSNWLDGGAPYYRCYETKDGHYVALGALEPAFFREFLELAGLPLSDLKLREDPANWRELHERYEVFFRTASRQEWTEKFENSDACVTPVLDLEEARDHAQNTSRNTFISCDGVVQAAPAPRFSRSKPDLPLSPPAVGQHTEAVLRECGYTDDAIESLLNEVAAK